MTTTKELLSVQAGSINATVQKSGSGDPVLYLHGAFDYKGWPDYLELLAQRYTVYAPLPPGFDEAEGLDRIDDLLDLVLYHFDLMDALDLEAPHIVGHFSGAMVAAEMAAVCSHRVGRLVLAAPAGLWLDDDQGVDYNAIPASDLRKVRFFDAASDAAKATLPEPSSDEELGWQIIDRTRSLASVAKFLWPIPEKGLKKRARRIKARTLIMMGDADQIVPLAYADILSSQIANARVHVMNDAGHLFNLEQPDEFARVISEFLTE
jgi:pimeloyl-ACP methyl ester carboxylesterase